MLPLHFIKHKVRLSVALQACCGEASKYNTDALEVSTKSLCTSGVMILSITS